MRFPIKSLNCQRGLRHHRQTDVKLSKNPKGVTFAENTATISHDVRRLKDSSLNVDECIMNKLFDMNDDPGKFKMRSWRLWLAPFLLMTGVAASVALIKTGPKPRKREYVEDERQVRAIKSQRMTVVPKVVGHGQARPAKTWDAVAQVSGKIVWKNPRLKSGEFFKEDDPLLRIDDSLYKLRTRSSEAAVKKCEAKIQELNSLWTNLEKQVGLQRQTLAMNEKNWDRQKRLFKSKVVSQAVMEEEEISVLKQKNSLENLQSSLNLIPAQIAYQEAELAAAQASLEQAQLDVEHTRIHAPFDCLVDDVSVEELQFVSEGGTLFEIDSIDKAEVTARFRIEQLSMLVGEPPTKVSEKLEKSMPGERRPPANGFKAVVNANDGASTFSWHARFERFSSGIDSLTRMVGMVVSVDKPYNLNHERFQPPLAKGLFCEVEVTGRAQPDLLVVPRDALHDGAVYLVDDQSRLIMRKVIVKFVYDKYAVVAEGLEDGEMLVTSDLLPAVEGMKIAPVLDESFYEKANEAIGAGESEAKKW